MTRSQRRARNRARFRLDATTATPFRHPGDLAANPNRGKLRTARAGVPTADAVDIAARKSRRDYAPLTVATPYRDKLGRRNPRMGHSSYTV